MKLENEISETKKETRNINRILYQSTFSGIFPKKPNIELNGKKENESFDQCYESKYKIFNINLITQFD
ncbi:MAG: hypothetical protein IPL53_06380 [Ignavibacteria bacterium]|nr:hypothetical protein [Ignavibacteria bacterium]